MSPMLGNLEETILLLVLVLGDQEAYGVSVAEAHLDQMGKSISIPAVHTVLSRLEEKGLLKSALGEASPVRGGKRKRIYRVTKLGYRILTETRASRIKLWDQVPAFKLA
jgi:DNA-binding PadR family transcriptional regulator